MPSERVQHAYGLIQKTLQQSGIIHGSSKQHQGSDSNANPYGYSNVSQQTSWQHAGPPPPPPASGYGQNAFGSMLGGSPAAPGPPAPPLVTPTQVTYNSPPIPPPYGPLNPQTHQSWTTVPQSHAGTAAVTSSYAPTPQQTQAFQSMFPPPPPLPPKPQDYSVHPPPLPPRPGTQGPPPDQPSAWSRPQIQTVQSTPSFQSPPPTAHHIYRKYGHVLQDSSGTPTNTFQPPSALQNQTPTAPLPPPPPLPPQQAWQQPTQGSYQNIYTTTPQQQTWQAPAAHQQTPVSPMQHDQQMYATPHTPINQSYPPPPQLFQSPAQQTPLKVPSVSPPPYNWAQPPPMQPGPAPSDYFQRNEHSTTPQPYFQRPPSLGNNPYQRPASLGNNPYNPPVSPPIPTVSPLVSRQGSVNSQQGTRDRHDTVSSISTTAAYERHDTFSTVSTLGERPATPKAGPQSEAAGGVSGQKIQSTGAGATTAAGTSASALGFGGPGGWEYYAAPGEEDGEEEEVAVGKSEAKDHFKAAEHEHEPVSPVELPSDPAPFAMKPTATAETKGDEANEDTIFELPADFVMATSVKSEVSGDQSKEGMAGEGSGQDVTIVLPKPSTRYNRIPRPQDLIPDLGPWYASSLERFISMLKTEAHAASDEQRAAAFVEFVATESKLRGIPYYTQPPGADVQSTVRNGDKRPKLPLEIPPGDAATEMEIQYSPGGRPVWRPKPKDRQNSADEAKTTVPGESQQQAYKPFRQGQSTADGGGSGQTAVSAPTNLPSDPTSPITATQQVQYKPYTPSTPAVEAVRRHSLPRKDSFPRSDSFPHRSSVSSPIRQEHTETFFPAPLALHSKKDNPASSSTPKPTPSIAAPPPEELSTPENSLPYPTTPSHTPPPPQPPALSTKPALSSLTPAPLAPSTVTAPPAGAARLRALLANFKPSSSSAETTTQIVTTLSALPPLDTTKAHIAALNASFDGLSPPAAPAAQQARALYDELTAERGEQQVLNDMAFEANEITYPQLMGRDEALKQDDAEKVAARAAGLMDAAGKRYRAWEEAVFAGVYGRVREEVGAGVEGLAVVEDVGAEAVKGLEGAEQQAPAAAAGGGLVKINARTGEVITVDGPESATTTAKPPQPDSVAATSSAAAGANVAQTLSALTTLTTSARALLTLHAHISARHALLAATVADRDARYAAAETAPLEFLVAFDECENPHSTTTTAGGKKAAAADKEEGKGDNTGDADADARKKLLDLRKHFTAARLGAAARAAADEEVRARQTWQRVEGWMAAGLAAVAKAVESASAAARQVEANDDGDVGGLLDRAEAVVGELARRAQELVRCFHEAEVLLNEAEFAVSVEEARAAVFEKAVARGDGPTGWGGWDKEAGVVVEKLEEERRNEDGVLKEELESRLRVIDTEQKAKAMEVVRRVRKRVVGREEFGDEDRIVGWVS